MEIDIFDRNNIELYYNDIYVLDLMNRFFRRLPERYRVNYNNNLHDLTLIKSNYGKYYQDDNLLIFDKPIVLIHELMHMASYDKYLNMDGLVDRWDNGIGINEGMTEYLTMSATLGGSPSTYYLQTFAAEMLLNLVPIFECYFVPDYDKAGMLFKESDTFSHLIYLLDYYTCHELKENPSYDVTILLVKRILYDLMMIGINYKRNSYDYEIYKCYFKKKYIEYSKKYSIFRLDEVRCYLDEIMTMEYVGNKRRIKKTG